MTDKAKELIELNKSWIRSLKRSLKWYNYWRRYPGQKEQFEHYMETYKYFMRFGVKIMAERRK